MKYVIQRVHEASVTIDHKETRTIGPGLVVYVGISHEAIQERPQKIEKFVSKVKQLKIFEDTRGKIHASLQDIQGEMLLISNFTLHGRNQKGASIDFSHAAPFADAKVVYEGLVHALQQAGIRLQTGEFGAYMEITSRADGPVNILLTI